MSGGAIIFLPEPGEDLNLVFPDSVGSPDDPAAVEAGEPPEEVAPEIAADDDDQVGRPENRLLQDPVPAPEEAVPPVAVEALGQVVGVDQPVSLSVSGQSPTPLIPVFQDEFLFRIAVFETKSQPEKRGERGQGKVKSVVPAEETALLHRPGESSLDPAEEEGFGQELVEGGLFIEEIPFEPVSARFEVAHPPQVEGIVLPRLVFPVAGFSQDLDRQTAVLVQVAIEIDRPFGRDSGVRVE